MEKINLLLKNPTFLKYQFLILPTVSILICLTLLILVAIPQFFKLQENGKKLKEIDDKNNFFINKTQKLEQINPQDYEENLNAALVALPDDKDIPGVIGQVQSLISFNNLTLDNMSFSNPGGQPGSVSNYLVRIQVSGTMDNLKKFIEQLKDSPRLLRLSAIGISGVQTASSKVQSDMDLTTYFQSYPKEIGGLESQIDLLSESDKQILIKLKSYLAKAQTPVSSDLGEGSGKADPFQ